MELNTEIWGDSSHQVLQSNTNSNHIAVSDIIPDIYTYYDTYGMDEPIDNSIALWQIADNSWFNKVLWLRRDSNNVIQKAETTTINAKSLWLCVPVTYDTNHNIHFNPSQYQCNLWDPDSTSTYYVQPNTNLRGIVTGFNYNRLQLRVTVRCALFDPDTKEHASSGSTISVYDYFHASDPQDRAYKDYYALEAFNIFVGTNDGIDQTYETISLNNPKSISARGRLYTNTMYNTPPTTDGYYKPEYLYYCQNNSVFGLSRTQKTTIPQQAVFGGNTSYYIGGFDSQYWELDEFRVSSTDYIATRCTASYEEVLKQLAYFGLWFNETDTGGTIRNIIGEGCTDDNVILPEIIGGRTTGNFKRGEAAGADPQATWGNTWRENVGYTGDKPYSGDSGDTGDLSTVFHRPVLSGSCIYYNMITTELKQLINAINSGYQPADNDQFILDFKGVNPADYISSIIYYPEGFTCGNVENQVAIPIKIGALELTLTSYEADISNQNIVSFGTLPIRPYYHDFRDYAPYTTIDLYIPFCGNVELDPAVFMGHTLQVYLFIDFPTGNCTGVVMRDAMVYDTISGSCGVSIPLTAQNVGSYQNAIKSAEIALKQAEIQRKTAWLSIAGSGLAVVGGAVSGNPLAVVGGIAGMLGSVNSLERAELSVKAAEYQLEHIAPSVRSVSAASPANALCMDYDCHLLIKRPVDTDDYDSIIYGSTVGNACCINDYLSAFHGLTVCSNIYLNGAISDYISIDDATFGGNSATAQEIALINQALENGVYLP